MRRLFLLATLVLVGPACATADSWPAAFAETAARELECLRAGVTPADWLAGHPGEQVERFTGDVPDPEWAGYWCARVRRQIAQDGGTVVRTAYFYVPDKPSSGALPDDEARPSGLVMTHCQLGLVRVSGAKSDGAVGRAAALATRDALAALYGTPPAIGMSYGLWESGLRFDAARFDTISHWRIGPRHVLSAYNVHPVGSPEVLAVAALPISGMAAERMTPEVADDQAITDDALIDAVVKAAGIPRSSTKPILDALQWTRHVVGTEAPELPCIPPDVIAALGALARSRPTWQFA